MGDGKNEAENANTAEKNTGFFDQIMVVLNSQKPWMDFFNPKMFTTKQSSLTKNFSTNLEYFKSNYAIITVVLIIIATFVASIMIELLVFAITWIVASYLSASNKLPEKISIDMIRLLLILVLVLILIIEGKIALCMSLLFVSLLISSIHMALYSQERLSQNNNTENKV